MKTKTIFLFIAIASLITLDSCKKGDNDPGLSLRSRTARLEGDWKLESGTITTTTGANTTIETYNGATLVVTYNGTEISNEAYTTNMTFEKNGKYERSGLEDTVTYTENGFWAWINKNKDAELKNKEAVGLSSTKYTDSNGSISTDNGFYVALILIFY